MLSSLGCELVEPDGSSIVSKLELLSLCPIWRLVDYSANFIALIVLNFTHIVSLFHE